MGGYAYCVGPCVGCGRAFTFNPMKVPSVRVGPPPGEREPVCRGCVDKANPEREKRGLAPIVPEPDAYEACPEEELDWSSDHVGWGEA